MGLAIILVQPERFRALGGYGQVKNVAATSLPGGWGNRASCLAAVDQPARPGFSKKLSKPHGQGAASKAESQDTARKLRTNLGSHNAQPVLRIKRGNRDLPVHSDSRDANHHGFKD